jgi:hypothetical protein
LARFTCTHELRGSAAAAPNFIDQKGRAKMANARSETEQTDGRGLLSDEIQELSKREMEDVTGGIRLLLVSETPTPNAKPKFEPTKPHMNWPG